MDTAGLYTAGVKVAAADGSTLADLFMANNDASHMLIVGKSADMGSPLLTGGPNWVATEDEPAEVGDGAMGVSWDQTGVATESLAVSIGGQATGFVPQNPSVQLGTEVTWTNADSITHTVTDKDAQFDSFDMLPGESYSLTFTEVGVFNYYCKFHPMMEDLWCYLHSLQMSKSDKCLKFGLPQLTLYSGQILTCLMTVKLAFMRRRKVHL